MALGKKRMNKPKILVFSCFDSRSHHGCSYTDLAKITMPSYEEYCKIHGYDFLVKTEFNSERPMPWGKFELMFDKLPIYDWIFYVECDSMLMNQTIKLENIIDDNYDIVISKSSRLDIIEVNTGPIMIKKSEWSKQFLYEILNHRKQYYTNQMLEQQMMIDEINGNEDVRKRCKIVNYRTMNSFAHGWHLNDNFQIGDFICHAAGSSNDYRIKLFNYLKNHIIKMLPPVNYNPFVKIGDNP